MKAHERIGIIGDFNPTNPTHIATGNAIRHAAAALRIAIEAVWLPTDEPHDLAAFGGLLCSPGSPYRSMEGALAGIRFARENRLPLIGTCAGFQHIVIGYARNVLGFEDAAHAESHPEASRFFITPLSCSLVGKTMEVTLKPGSRSANALGATRSVESFYCNFGLNPEYQEVLESGGLAITGTDQNGEARVVEISSHPFFIGTLFVPQARSEPGHPHPLILDFCKASCVKEIPSL